MAATSHMCHFSSLTTQVHNTGHLFPMNKISAPEADGGHRGRGRIVECATRRRGSAALSRHHHSALRCGAGLASVTATGGRPVLKDVWHGYLKGPPILWNRFANVSLLRMDVYHLLWLWMSCKCPVNIHISYLCMQNWLLWNKLFVYRITLLN